MTALTSPASPLLHIDNVTRSFDVGGKRALVAVRNVTLRIQPGEVVGLVGESGSGKSTIGRMAIALLPPTEGRITFDGTDLASMATDDLRRLRQRMQIIFQDPWGALNPRHTIGRLMEEPLLLHTTLTAAQRREAARCSCRRERGRAGGQAGRQACR